MRIGFIGAGLMGHGMVLRLLKAGHQVTVVAHKNRQPIDDLVSKGATEAASLASLAQGSEYIVLCLSNSKVVTQVVAGLRPWLADGQIMIDTSTSEPQLTRDLALELAHLGITYVDAPLTGGPEQAANGELGVLCGASPENYARVSPLLACFASTVCHVGPVGSGHVAKLISNYLVTGMIALVSESFAAARHAGIDWRELYAAMLNGSGNSGVLRKMVGPALEGNFDGYRFSLDNAFKDIGYYCRLAPETDLAKAVESVFSAAIAKGQGAQNVSFMLKGS